MLQYESQKVRYLFGCIWSFLKNLALWAVTGHAWVQASASRHKAFLFSVIDSTNVTHEFSHGIPVEIRWPESFFHYQPPCWKDDEVANGLPIFIRLCSQYREDAGVRVVLGDGSTCLEQAQVVLVWSVVSMPPHNIEGWPVYLIGEEFSKIFVNHCPFFFFFIIASRRNLEILRVCFLHNVK